MDEVAVQYWGCLRSIAQAPSTLKCPLSNRQSSKSLLWVFTVLRQSFQLASSCLQHSHSVRSPTLWPVISFMLSLCIKVTRSSPKPTTGG